MIRLTGTSLPPPVEMEVVTDALEIERAWQRRSQADRNWEWLHSQMTELANANRGRYVCVAGQEAFLADDPSEACRMARAVHPEDEGAILFRFRTSNLPLVYAHSG